MSDLLDLNKKLLAKRQKDLQKIEEFEFKWEYLDKPLTFDVDAHSITELDNKLYLQALSLTLELAELNQLTSEKFLDIIDDLNITEDIDRFKED